MEDGDVYDRFASLMFCIFCECVLLSTSKNLERKEYHHKRKYAVTISQYEQCCCLSNYSKHLIINSIKHVFL